VLKHIRMVALYLAC